MNTALYSSGVDIDKWRRDRLTIARAARSWWASSTAQPKSSWQNRFLSRGLHAAKLAYSHHCHWGKTVLRGVLSNYNECEPNDAEEKCRRCLIADIRPGYFGSLFVVGLSELNLNAQLVRVLREGPAAASSMALDSSDLSRQKHRRWKIRNRFSNDEIAHMVKAFKAGTPKHVLAKRYEMNLRSVKKLLREEGVKRTSWRDIQP